MNGLAGIWAARVLLSFRAVLRRDGRAAACDPVRDRAAAKAALSARLSPHLRKDVGADEG
jgi:hypothetical protein